MKIKTITCHDVYNVGASLQAYALSQYLNQQGHDVEIIDYKPDYLSKRYNFLAVDNPRFEKPFLLKAAYLLLKFPKRLREYPGKKNFDTFRKNYLKLTKRYCTLEELKANPPTADLYLAGSDQIWNTLFQNGRDGAFYLDFAPAGAKRASYAASFATEEIAPEWEGQVKAWLSNLDKISVRERSSLTLLEKMGLQGRAVLDPVFLLSAEQWKKMLGESRSRERKKIFIYDFDGNELMESICRSMKEKKGYKIISFFHVDYADDNMRYPGPLEFLQTIYHADVIISNSFHATVFSLIFHKEFYVIRRNENINVRMMDLLKLVGLDDRMIASEAGLEAAKPIDWNKVDKLLAEERGKSVNYLMELTNEES